MIFNSIEFAIFMPVVFLLYYAIPHSKRWLFLLISSYYFYMSFKPELIVLILISTLIDYYASISMVKYEKYKKYFLSLSICSNLGLLFFFKYFNFFNNAIGDLLKSISIPFTPTVLNIILPVGISFYTFQTLSYTIDVYRGKIAPERHLGYFALYVCFFPQLVAGPIERAEKLLPQFREEHTFNYDNVTYGLKLMAWGFFKKLAVADVVAPYVNIAYTDVYKHAGLALIVATLLFSVQIYCDFSGYSDIARGCSKMLGFELMENFKSPYLATNIQNFWQRWHISLSKWFTDYVYIPLGGKHRYVLCTLVAFALSGLWHGANYTYVIWGLINGICIIFYRKFIKKPTNIVETTKKPYIYIYIYTLLKIGITFAIVCFSWIFFRANTLSDALFVATNLFTGISDIKQYIYLGYFTLGIDSNVLISLILRISTLLLFDIINDKKDVITCISNMKTIPRWSFYIIFMYILVLISNKGIAPEFIYFQF